MIKRVGIWEREREKEREREQEVTWFHSLSVTESGVKSRCSFVLFFFSSPKFLRVVQRGRYEDRGKWGKEGGKENWIPFSSSSLLSPLFSLPRVGVEMYWVWEKRHQLLPPLWLRLYKRKISDSGWTLQRAPTAATSPSDRPFQSSSQ